MSFADRKRSNSWIGVSCRAIVPAIREGFIFSGLMVVVCRLARRKMKQRVDTMFKLGQRVERQIGQIDRGTVVRRVVLVAVGLMVSLLSGSVGAESSNVPPVEVFYVNTAVIVHPDSLVIDLIEHGVDSDQVALDFDVLSGSPLEVVGRGHVETTLKGRGMFAISDADCGRFFDTTTRVMITSRKRISFPATKPRTKITIIEQDTDVGERTQISIRSSLPFVASVAFFNRALNSYLEGGSTAEDTKGPYKQLPYFQGTEVPGHMKNEKLVVQFHNALSFTCLK
jgi:hypothetical protein